MRQTAKAWSKFALRWRGYGIDKDDGQYDAGDGSIEPIVFVYEIDKRKHHSHYGGEQQGYDAHLNDAIGLEVEKSAEDAAQPGIFGMGFIEYGIILYGLVAMLHQVYGTAHQCNGTSYGDTPAQGVAYYFLDVALFFIFSILLCHFLNNSFRESQKLPLIPLYIILSATRAMARQKILRKVLTLSVFNSLAPVSAPASTPTITGKAMPGSMLPRCR